MTWIAVLLIGLAVGWGLELLLDFWFWGRRIRRLNAKLSNSRSNLQSSKQKLERAEHLVSQCQAKEDQYQACQYNLADMVDQKDQLETQTEKLSVKLQASGVRIGQLHAQLKALRLERDQLHDTLEQVDQWAEASMRQRVWEAPSWQHGIRHAKERSMAYTRSLAATAHSQVGRVTEKISSRYATAKAQIGRTTHQFRPKRLFNRSYCTMWKLIGMLNKNVNMPQSCSIERN